jgi:hypothetical protein
MESSKPAALSTKQAFEPSELVDHGQVGDISRAGTSGTSDTADGYDS